MEKEDKINALLDQATDALVNDSPEKAAEALQELAYMCSKGGSDGKAMFEQLRRLAITGAESQTSKPFIAEKLQAAELKLMEKRNGSRIIH